MERERNQTEQVTSQYSCDNIGEKNERRAQSQRGPKETDLNEMRQFLKGAMDTINAFAKQLDAQTNSSLIHSDK